MSPHKQIRPRLILGALALALVAHPARAQVAVDFTPFAGGVIFLTDLVEGARIDAGPALGAHGSLRVAGPLALRGTFAFLPSESAIGAPRIGGRGVSLLLFVGGITVDLPARGRITPFVSAGAGAKRYHFSGLGVDPETDATWSAGLGARLPLRGRADVQFEVADYMSSFDPETAGVAARTQHDVVGSVGVRFPLFGAR